MTAQETYNTDRNFEALLSLTRAGLWDKQPGDMSVIPNTAEDWEEVLRLARQQTVTGIAYMGLQHIPDDLMPPEPLLMRWTAYADAIERSNRSMNDALASLTAMLRGRGLTPIIQKGQGVAQFYGHPLLRECGDIDLYFRTRRAWDSAMVWVRRRGIRISKMPDKSVSYRWQGVEVEHHRHLFDLHNPFLQGAVSRLEHEHGYSKLTVGANPGIMITVPSPMLNLLLQNLHILKHAIGWGIGLRQLCDMARSCYVLHSQVDSREMEDTCHRLGLSAWSPLLHSFLVRHLGLPEEHLPYPAMSPSADRLYDIIRRGGNFGHYMPWRNADAPALNHKLQTLRSFMGNIRFTYRYAPKEAFWVIAGLLKGQLR